MLQRKQRNNHEINSKQNTEINLFNRKNLQIFTAVILLAFISYLSIDYIMKKDTELLEENTIERPILNSKITPVDSMNSIVENKILRKAQIEILNGCGISGLSNNLKQFFLKEQLDVIGINNYKDFLQTESFFIVYNENYFLQIVKIAQKMKISESRVKKEFISQPLNEVTFVIGSDYPKLVY